MAEDLRLSVDAPVDLVQGIFAALITAGTFIGVLWFIGGEFTVPIGSTTLHIPGFLVITAFIYSALASGSMIRIARGFVVLSENKNQAEAEYIMHSLVCANTARALRCLAAVMRSTRRSLWHLRTSASVGAPS